MPSTASGERRARRWRSASTRARGWRARRQVAPVGVDVLPQQRHLAHAIGRHRLGLLHELCKRAADLAPTRGGHDAVGARAVAAHADLQPSLERSRPQCRQVAGEALELEVPLRRERIADQELGQPMDLAGTKCDVDEREALEDLVLQRLRPAAANPDHPLGPFPLQAPRFTEMGDEAAVGRLADRARVEQDEVGVAAPRGLGVAERAKHALHPLGVVLVHLAAERGHVVALHGPQGSPALAAEARRSHSPAQRPSSSYPARRPGPR